MPRRWAACDGPGQRLDQPGRRLGRPAACRRAAAAEAAARDELQREVGLAVVLADLVDLDDVRGAASRATASASVRNRASWPSAGVRAGQDHLQGDQAVQAELPGLVDDAHAAPAELAEDLVAGRP